MSFSETAIMSLANFMPHHFDAALRSILGSRIVSSRVKVFMRNKLRNIDELERILVVADTNIGDAVLLQNAVTLLKHYFPKCKVDYIYQEKATTLIQYNPYIDNHLPYFVQKEFITKDHNKGISESVPLEKYNLIINFYPFFSKGALKLADCPVITSLLLIRNIVKSHNDNVFSHVLDHIRIFLDEIVQSLPAACRGEKSKPDPLKNIIYLSQGVGSKTSDFLEHLHVPDSASVAFLNPDTSSRFTCIPEHLQKEILVKMLRFDLFDYYLLGPGFTFQGIEKRVYNEISSKSGKEKIKILPPDIPIDLYTGLIDRADVFISGDTAQMHIAAAYKVSDKKEIKFKNKTALIGVYGATRSAIYGYDTFLPNHRDSDQNAPARVFEGTPRCKNLTCIHKTKKKCPTVRCFQGVDSDEIIDYIRKIC